MKFTKTSYVVVRTVLLTIFVFHTLWGLADAYRLDLCETSIWSCNLVLEIVIYCFGGALISAGTAFLCVWMFRNKLMFRDSTSVSRMAFLCAVLLVGLYPYVLDLREAIAVRFFPYVIAFRFYLPGFVVVWGTLSLLVCAAVMGIATSLDIEGSKEPSRQES